MEKIDKGVNYDNMDRIFKNLTVEDGNVTGLSDETADDKDFVSYTKDSVEYWELLLNVDEDSKEDLENEKASSSTQKSQRQKPAKPIDYIWRGKSKESPDVTSKGQKTIDENDGSNVFYNFFHSVFNNDIFGRIFLKEIAIIMKMVTRTRYNWNQPFFQNFTSYECYDNVIGKNMLGTRHTLQYHYCPMKLFW